VRCCWMREGIRTLTRRRLQPGVFRSLVDLQAAINRYLGEHNRKSKPFVWTADPERIIKKVNRGHQVITSNHQRWLLLESQADNLIMNPRVATLASRSIDGRG
jgi:hypothetical protein